MGIPLCLPPPFRLLEDIAARFTADSGRCRQRRDFLSLSLAKLGYQVICTDTDPICEKDLSLAQACVPHSPGTVDFRLINDDVLPFGDAECDAVYCISVLEHIPDFEKTIAEMARILKTGGLCLITCDINLRAGDKSLQLDVEHYKRLLSYLSKGFERIYPEITMHPTDMLTTTNSPYPLRNPSSGPVQFGWNILKQRIIKPLLGRKPCNIKIPYVTVLGLVLKKRV